MPIIRNFERRCSQIGFDVVVDEGVDLKPANILKLRKSFLNGRSVGSIFYLNGSFQPRISYTYLRYSLPLFGLRGLNKKPLKKDTIYIVPGGGVFFSNKDYPIFSEINQPVLKLYNTKKNCRYGIKFTTCFLKSSFVLWYCNRKFDDCNMFLPEILSHLPLPTLNTKDPEIKDHLDKTERHFSEILDVEKTYLITARKMGMSDELKTLTENHNKTIDSLAYEIDKQIYKLLKLNDTEISLIEDDLRLNNFYVPTYK
jgi:hypothetical protein